MTQTLLAIENLSVGFRHQQTVRTVVNDVSLQIEAGETLALVGESGSGKSVTALSILRLLPSPPVEYLSGDIRFHGESLLHASDQTLRGVRGNKIAMIFQEPMVSLNPLHTLEKQLYEVLSLHRGMRREAARGEILNCLDRVGIRQAAKRLTDYPHQLSGGERQRVMIAMALLTRPELLIADEPTTALDVSVQAQILQLLRELQGELNMGMLFITHNLSIVRKLAHRVAVMQNGRCVEQNYAATLFASPTHPYTQKLLNSEPSGDPVPLPEPASTLLDVEQLQVAFPIRKGILKRIVDHNVVVKNISFTLRAGETLGLVGESGSGKSTTGLALLRLINSQGSIIFDGQPLQNLNRRQLLPIRHRIQVVFQDPNSSLNPRLNVLQIIEDPACRKYAKDVKVSMYMYDRPAWTGHVYETECFFPTWINKESAPHVQALVEAYHNLWGTERIGADEKALSTRTGRPLTDKWTFSTNGVSIQGRYGIPCVGFGPGAESQAHAPNEITWKQDLAVCAALYAAVPMLYNPENKDGSATSFRQELTGNDIK